MASGTVGSSLKHLRDLFGGGTAVGVGDGELLRRYAASRDGSAFAALVVRHGPMVAATCRAVLRDHHDVEDAFQATFLVLARKAGSIHAGDALGGWLHRVAYRAAVQRSIEVKRRRRHESELSPMDVPEATTRPALDFDVSSILHEEIERLPDSQRLPVVFCDLEGLTYEQAAGRLHCTVPTLYHRLSRGRKRLRSRLVRRGVTAIAAGAAIELSQASATAAVPSAWARDAVAAATGGPIPATAAALAHVLIKSLLMTRLKFAIVTFLGIVALASAGVIAGAARPDAPKTAPASPVVDDPKPDAAPSDSTVNLTVEARDLATAAPVPDVRIVLQTFTSDERLSATTDASGAARFAIPADARQLYLTASREGYVPQAIQWDHDGNSPGIPGHLLFQMEKGTRIAGRVVDQDHKPIAGATVVIDVAKTYPGYPQRVNLRFSSTDTDASGRWTFANIPERPDSIKVTAYHHLCLTQSTCFLPEPYTATSALRDGSATLGLRRGTIIDGTVVAPDGRPVAGAEIVVGTERRYGNSIPPAKTDSQGHFALGFAPGVATRLTAVHTGFADATQTLRVGSEPQRVTLRLQEGHTLSGRVVDRTGKPVPRAYVRVKPSAGVEWSRADLRTDQDGRFAWNDAPEGEVQVDTSAEGFSGKTGLRLLPGSLHEIVLGSPTSRTTIAGTVLDGATGRPIPRFSLLFGSVWDGRTGVVWQRGFHLDREARKAPGSFEHTLYSEHGDRFAIRVEAEGYLPEDSGIITSDGGHQALTYRLTRAGPIRGTIRNPDGEPSADGFVYLVLGDYEQRLDNGDFFGVERRLRAKPDADGRFSLPPQKDDFLLVALSDAGFAVARRSELRGDDTIRLQPWARIAGTLKVGGVPVADAEICSFPDQARRADGVLHLENWIFVKTDAAGRFVMPRVMPGRHVIQQKVTNNRERRLWSVDLATLDVASGRTYHLKLGERGRTVTGRLSIPTDEGWMVRKASIEARDAKGQQPSIGVHVSNDGRFRALDLPPGDHVLRIAIHEPPPDNACGWGRLVAAYSRQFTVSEKDKDRPLDLGILHPAELGGKPLRAGDAAPDFAVKTLDDKDLTLAEFRGRFVLLDFWATWCGPCVAEMPNLEAVHKAFGADPRFAMVSLSLDDAPADARSFVKARKLSWPQGHVGPDSAVVAAYHATAIPATFLVGPDGKILGTDLRGPRLKSAIAEALGSRKPGVGTSAP